MSEFVIAVTIVGLISIAASSLFYTWIWYRPSDWLRLCKGGDPCKIMANYAHILKAIQFICMFILLDKPEVFRRLQDPATLVPGLAFVIFGQHLNARVYDLLGVDGVYYGFRFGKSIPWRTEWPYNSLRDPQYIGASSTLLGALILGAPSTLCFHWLSNYMYLMWLESRVPADVSALS